MATKPLTEADRKNIKKAKTALRDYFQIPKQIESIQTDIESERMRLMPKSPSTNGMHGGAIEQDMKLNVMTDRIMELENELMLKKSIMAYYEKHLHLYDISATGVQILKMFYLDDMSYTEIGDKLGYSKGAIYDFMTKSHKMIGRGLR